jgi:hypothetical protein
MYLSGVGINFFEEFFGSRGLEGVEYLFLNYLRVNVAPTSPQREVKPEPKSIWKETKE